MEPVWKLSTTPPAADLSLTESFGLLSDAGDFLFSDMLGAADAYIGRQSRLNGKQVLIKLTGKYEPIKKVDGEV